MNHRFLNISCKYGILMLSTIMTDMNGKPVPFVLFQVGAPGVNLFITEKGLTYCFMEEVKDASTALSMENEREEKTGLPVPTEEEGEFKPFNWSRIDMGLAGASIKKSNIITEGRSNSFNQYYLGHLPAGKAGCPDGVLDVHSYTKITIKEIYPGIDWVFYNSGEKGFKYDFAVHPGADPGSIKLLYRSGKRLHFDQEGNIQIQTPYGTLTENAPISYIKETGENIRTKFVKTKVTTCRPTQVDEGYETQVVFNLEHGTRNLEPGTLIIDPQLVWSTFYDGASSPSWTSQDGGFMDIATDAAGNLFICGYTGGNVTQNTFPTINPGNGAYFQGVYGGGAFFAYLDAVILKFNPSGVCLWSTYYGGGEKDLANSITVDNAGNVFVTGYTGSGYDPIYNSSTANFPTQNPGAGAYFQGAFAGGSGTMNGSDVFILKFNNAGVRLWATYYGGGGDDRGNSIITDNAGNVFVTGYTISHYNTPPQTTFPTQNALGGAYFQGANAANGTDAFILKFTNSGIRQWATFYGGSAEDTGNSIAVDGIGNVFVTGKTGATKTPSNNFPTNPGPAGAYFQAYGGGPFSTVCMCYGLYGGDAFILKFSSSGVQLWATFYGGSDSDVGNSIATDCSGNVFVTGSTKSTDLPTLNTGGNSYYKSILSGSNDAFILKFDNAGKRLWATYYGGAMNEYDDGVVPAIPTWSNIQTDECGHLFVSFETGSSDIPVQFLSGAYFDGTFNGYNDIYLARFSNTGVLQWGTYFGGDGNDFRSPIALDDFGNLFVAGEWTINNIPSINNATYPLTTPGGGAYYDNSFNGGRDDMYIAKLGFEPEINKLESRQDNPVGCSACNGKAKVTAKCDMAGLSYVWSTGRTVLNITAASDSISGLCAGNYWVEVTSACGEKDTAWFSLSNVNCGCSMSASIIESPGIKCIGTTGGAIVTVSNGPGGPYTYNWSNGTNAITSSTLNQATNLPAGTYTVRVITGSCVSVSSVTLSQPLPVIPKITQPVCAANLGTATASATGGSPPYLYSWSTGSTSPAATGLNLGTYTVTITDSKGCTSSELTSIKEPMLVGPSSGNITCSGYSYAGITTNFGTSPYTYSWSNGSTVGGNCGNPCLNKNLAAGTYTVTVTDGNECTVTRSVTITGSSAASATFTAPPACINQATCFTHTGSAGTHTWSIGPPVSVSGSTTNFCYTFLTAGTYSVTHTVSNAGCTNTVTQYINGTNCNGPTVTATGTSVCPGSCAAITSSSTGGTGPYTYLWNNGATTQNINPCPAATTIYTVTVTDSGGNTSTTTAVVNVNPSVSLSTTVTNINCNGSTNGSANANPNNGTPGFIYTWSNGGTTSQISNLTSQIYTVTVTDSKGCTATSTATITSPPPLSGQFTKGTASCSGCGCKEWIIINAAGGTNPYSYTWPDGYVNRYKNQLCPGTYTINIKDKNGCSVNVNLTAP
ncbi:MAG: SBBP repeat-containing protein [Bacteroidetes bacterium]|nr:SBBP repeat-containing protein [Bacteroidota bacterium]